ncbi:MobF family relaxase [Pseudonocardia pini]|uniref:MobF family relaxase n=1 Tax=Pseudonocardia pini TaxID=2758030 RepID=UPI0015F0488D|nr:MobF family relaxase [Pseudonocardia pini]
MLSLQPGHDTSYLTGAVAGGREGYYTGAVATGEPPGLWYGAGAEQLGLHGEVSAEMMEAVYTHLLDPRDPATASRSTWGEAAPLASAHKRYRSAEETFRDLLAANPHAGPEERAELRTRAQRSARQAVAFYDATFSAPKSVSVLGVAFERAETDARAAGDARAAEAWGTHRRAVEEAVMAGARASVDYLAEVAGYARVGHHGGGAGRWADAHGWVVAQFLQHDSRDRDPQLHVHQAILNRAPCADGTWRAIDGRAVHDHRGAAGALGERVMEAHLSRALGVAFAPRPDGKGREIVGISQDVLALFSHRRRAVTAEASRLIAAFTERFGREPSPLERSRLAQQATLATRSAKRRNGEDLGARLDRWERESRMAVRGGLAQIARDVLDRGQESPGADFWSPQDVVERALATATGRRQSWSRSDLMRAVSDSLPGDLDVAPERLRELLDRLTAQALDQAVHLSVTETAENLPAELRLDDGRSAYLRPGGERYTTADHIVAERELRAAAIDRGATALTEEAASAAVARFAASGHRLGVDQAAAVRGVLSSGARLEILAAPAGTGKSFTVGAIAEAWAAAGHTVIGLAPSQVAADVLADEGLDSTNIARWLRSEADLVPGALVVVDEAGMASTADLAAIRRRVSAADGKVLLLGDPRQLAAVGPGGALADLADRGITYRLAEVRRFSETWEREASLRLREGDETAVADYEKRGRLLDCGAREQTEAAAARGWLADTLDGRESLLVVGSNESAAHVSAELRSQLVDLGLVEARGVELGRQGTVAGVGDLVQARRNGWELQGLFGNARAPINRQTYRIADVLDDGGVVVTERDGTTLTLPAAYVSRDLTLAYATTVHAAQGRTVDTAHAVVEHGTDPAAIYVALTRGRDRNSAYMVTRSTPDDSPPGQTTTVQRRAAAAVLSGCLDRDRRDQAALAEFEESQAQSQSMQRCVDRIADGVAMATAGRLSAQLDRLVEAAALDGDQRVALAADPALGDVERLLRSAELAGHDPADLLGRAVGLQSLDSARSPAQVLSHRLRTVLDADLRPRIRSANDLVPDGLPDAWQQTLGRLADAADDRRHALGMETAHRAPQWAVEALGAVPEDADDRRAWEERAGWAAAYRETAGHDDPVDPLGPPPPFGLAERTAMWRAAHQVLDLPTRGTEEAECSDGQLRVRVAAMEREEAWAPAYVADELADARRQAEAHRVDARLWEARSVRSDNGSSLRTAADAAQREANSLTERIAELEKIDDARAAWYLHTLVTRDRATRARAELASRGIDVEHPRDLVRAEDWLDDDGRTRTDDLQAPSTRRDSGRTEPLSDATTEAVRVAQRALDTIHVRELLDDAREAEELDSAWSWVRRTNTYSADTTERSDGMELGR